MINCHFEYQMIRRLQMMMDNYKWNHTAAFSLTISILLLTAHTQPSPAVPLKICMGAGRGERERGLRNKPCRKKKQGRGHETEPGKRESMEDCAVQCFVNRVCVCGGAHCAGTFSLPPFFPDIKVAPATSKHCHVEGFFLARPDFIASA